MREYFILNGVDSRDFGVYISGQGTFSAPEKAYTFYNIPGRNGALLGNEHRLENIEVSYEAFIYTDFDNQIAAFRSFLLSIDGYAKLTDSYHPDEYRMAVYQGPFEPTVERTNDVGKFVITFSCKPQRFLLDGETWYKWAGNYTYQNGEDINGTTDVDSAYMQLNYSIPVPTGYNPRPNMTHDYYVPPYVEIKANGNTICSITKTTAETVVTYNLVAGTGSVTQKKLEAAKSGWTLYSTNTFRHSISNVSSIVYCSHYSMSNQKQYYCYYDSGYVYIHDPDYSTANDFNAFMAIRSIWFTANLTTPESVTIQSYTPNFSVPFSLSAYWGVNSSSVSLASERNDIEEVISVRYYTQTTSSTMVNPTVFKSQPLIRVYGNGSFTINGITIVTTNATSYTDIDCEMMDCYEGSTNRNNDVSFSTYDFPVLLPGDNPVAIVSGITEVDIQPRWWRV